MDWCLQCGLFSAFAAISREMEQAARSIGSGPWRTFIDISLPQALPGLMAAAINRAGITVVPSIVFMLVVERFLKADVLARIGK
ncbi:MAG: ABC transporter permease subunit [Symbiopectobacterium sp.]